MATIKTWAVILLLALTTVTHAQTATPHPNALPPGLYQFEDLSAPDIELTGADWSIRQISGGVEGLGNDDNGESLTFYVTHEVDYIIIHRYSGDVNNPEWQICIELDCHDIDESVGGLNNFAINTDANAQITLSKLNPAATIFDYMQLVQSVSVSQSVSGTGTNTVYVPIIATSDAPNYVDYAEATDEVGNPTYTRIENVVNPGDQFNVAGLSMIIILLFAILVVTLWQR